MDYPTKGSTLDQVYGNLWMGGWPPPDARLGQRFDCLVLTAMEYQPAECFGDVEVARALLNDDGSPMRREEAVEAVRAAGKAIRWLGEGKKVLGTCFAGRNRSGLVCALTLCRGPEAMGPDAAIEAVRAARGDSAFRNPWFEAFLRAYCGRQ